MNASSDLPPYCDYYPSIIDGKLIDNDDIEERKFYENICYDGESLRIYTHELEKLIEGVQGKTLDQFGERLEQELVAQAVKDVLGKKIEYEGLLFPPPNVSEELLNCGKVHGHFFKDDRTLYQKLTGIEQNYNPDMSKAILDSQTLNFTSENENKQKDFMFLNIVNSLKASSYLKRKKKYDLYTQQLKAKFNYERLTCRNKRESCRKNTSIFKNTKHCSVAYEECVENARAKKDSVITKMDKKLEPLYSMVGTSPLLFNNGDEGNILNSFSVNGLGPSPLMSEILRYIPEDIINKSDEIFKEGNISKIDKYLENSGPEILALLNDKKIFNTLQNETEKELKNEFKRLDDAALALCEGQGDNLHHYPSLVEKVGQKLLNQAKDKNEVKINLAVHQAGYCHLLRNKPKEQSKTSVAAISGFVMLGVGMGLQFIPGLGTVAGGVLLTVGTGLAYAGGTALTLQAIKDTGDVNAKLNREIGLQSAGLIGYNQVLETKKTRDSDTLWTSADILLVGIDLKALAYAKRNMQEQKIAKEAQEQKIELLKGTTARRYDFERRQQISEIEQELGGKNQIDNLLNSLYPVDKLNLSSGDKIYIAGIVDLVRKDVLKDLKKRGVSNKQQIDLEIEKEVKKVVDSIIKKCGQK